MKRMENDEARGVFRGISNQYSFLRISAPELLYVLLIVASVFFAGCLGYEDIEVRSDGDEMAEFWPVIEATEPPIAEAVIRIDKKCKGYRFRITKLVSSTTGEELTARDVDINWFLDYESDKNPKSKDLAYILYANSWFHGDIPGTEHIVEVVVSDSGFKDDGPYINWAPIPGGHWDHARWIIKVVDDDPPVQDPLCIGGFEGQEMAK